MTRDEVKQLHILIYHSFQNTKEPTSADVNSWYLFLEDEDANKVLSALKTFVKTSGSGFPPSLPQLIQLAHRIDDTCEDYADAWHLVRPMISRGYYHAEEDFETLPELVKQCLGSPQQIRNWSQLPSEDIDTNIFAQFRDIYKAKARRNEIEKTYTQIGARNGIGIEQK